MVHMEWPLSDRKGTALGINEECEFKIVRGVDLMGSRSLNQY